MAVIRFYQKYESKMIPEVIHYDGTVIGWVLENIKDGQNFKVYAGELCEENEISRDTDKMTSADDVSVILISGDPVTIIIAAVVAVTATLLLAPDIPNIQSDSGRQSPNNSLTDRRNKARPNQRIPDICGKVKSIPDVIASEYSRYVDNKEERYGYYCIARNQVKVEEIKDGDTLLSQIEGASAGVYYPGKSPNNSSPDIQVGKPINRIIYGVYEARDVIGQTIFAQNEKTSFLDSSFYVSSAGYIITYSGFNFDEVFKVGDTVSIEDVFIGRQLPPIRIGANTSKVTAVSASRIDFDVSEDPSWLEISGIESIERSDNPRIISLTPVSVGPFKNTEIKSDKISVNIYAPNGLFRQESDSTKRVSVTFSVTATILDDNFLPIGTPIEVVSQVSGTSSREVGTTVEIDLGAKSFYQVDIKRISNRSFSSDISDEIKLKNIYGLYTVDNEYFGNTTTIQTKRIANAQNAAIRNPEINCIATEMVYKYLGNGVFDTVLTPNTQAMQSLIRLALDPYVGRRDASELDLDGLIANQALVEEYFDSEDSGQFSYTFDDENTSAQEIFYTIANAAFCQVWREGRVLKSYFERPQSIPSMVFTHRSKAPNSETWSRETAQGKRKDSVELTYTDEDTYKKEVLYFPEDRSGRNPKKVEAKGVKGKAQATWRLMREYNKLVYSKGAVEFTATLEGSLVKPMQLISVVKGTRVGSYDGEILSVDGLTLELSQEIQFTAGDDHFILLKKRDGTLESIPAIDIGEKRKVQIEYAPQEAIYTGNSELKTEFSFGNEARLSGQLVIPLEIDASDGKYAKISAINYSDRYYDGDPIQVNKGDFNNDFNNDFGG